MPKVARGCNVCGNPRARTRLLVRAVVRVYATAYHREHARTERDLRSFRVCDACLRSPEMPALVREAIRKMRRDELL